MLTMIAIRFSNQRPFSEKRASLWGDQLTVQEQFYGTRPSLARRARRIRQRDPGSFILRAIS